MDEDIFDEYADELTLISNEWNNKAASRRKEGYADGVSAGTNVTVQLGFNLGFKETYASSVLLSKVKGILRAILEFHTLYDGQPITDATAHEAQLVLDMIAKIERENAEKAETNKVIDQISDMKLSSSGCGKDECCGGGCGGGGGGDSCNDDDEMMDVSNMQTNDKRDSLIESSANQQQQHDETQTNLLSSNELQSIIFEFSKVLETLGWTDELTKIFGN